ncbi:MAG: hypothetical protein HXK24_06400, partial [Lancefieldella parvula]|nr:hypothetical protein [Lancefieldella parvula]
VTEIEKNKRYRIRYWAETSQGYRRASETVRGTKRQAYDRLAELRLNHSEDAPAPTLGQVWDMWVLPRLEERRVSGDLSASTIDAYKRTWRLVFTDHRRDKNPVNTVRPLVVQSWFDEMTISHARNAKVILRLIYSECELRDICSADIARRPYHMPKNGQKRENGIWALDELHKLYGSIRGTYFEAWVIAAAFGGARVGETLAIRNEEVELVEFDGVPVAIIPITRQMTQSHGLSSRLKTTQSVHASVVPGPLGARLYELVQASEDEWILQGSDEEPMTQKRMFHVWQALVKQVGGVPYRPVSRLRNSWQTFTHWKLGVEREKIERMMGHKGTSVTEIHYDKPEAEMLAKTIAVAYKAHPYADNWDELGLK